jgi:hypothetical protein
MHRRTNPQGGRRKPTRHGDVVNAKASESEPLPSVDPVGQCPLVLEIPRTRMHPSRIGAELCSVTPPPALRARYELPRSAHGLR